MDRTFCQTKHDRNISLSIELAFGRMEESISEAQAFGKVQTHGGCILKANHSVGRHAVVHQRPHHVSSAGQQR